MRKIMLFAIIGLVLFNFGVDCTFHDGNGESNALETSEPLPLMASADDSIIEISIKKIESWSRIMQQSAQKLDTAMDLQLVYMDMVEEFDHIAEAIQDKDNAYDFLAANGVVRIISPYLTSESVDLRDKALDLLLILFDVTPGSTASVLPVNMVDKIIHVFETDDTMSVKAEALQVLYKWLPKNPKVQTRVIRTKGFEPFYNQVTKLSTPSIAVILELFNKLLLEHIAARDPKNQSNPKDKEIRTMYEQMAFIEHMSSSRMCHGLMNILNLVWNFDHDYRTVIIVFKSLKNIKVFCMRYLKNKEEAIEFLEVLQKFVYNEDRREMFEDMGLNITEYRTIVQDYIDYAKDYKRKDEL